MKSTEAITRGGFQRATSFRNALAVEDTEVKPEFGRELGLPLFGDGCRTDDEDASSAAAGVQLA